MPKIKRMATTLGYIQAVDERLFQMDMAQEIAGELSEIVGEATLEW